MLPDFDLTRVENRFLQQGRQKDELSLAVSEYRRFLFLCPQAEGKNVCCPPKIDDVWHAHMLDSVHYVNDCNKYFGFYLHHNPCENGVDPSDMESTFDLYEKTFDEKPNALWLELMTCANPGGGCGSITL